MLLHFLNNRGCALMQWNIQEKTWVWLFYYTDGLPWKILQQVIFWLDLLASCHCRSLISESPGKSKAPTFFLLAVNVCWTSGMCLSLVEHGVTQGVPGTGLLPPCPLCWAHPPASAGESAVLTGTAGDSWLQISHHIEKDPKEGEIPTTLKTFLRQFGNGSTFQHFQKTVLSFSVWNNFPVRNKHHSNAGRKLRCF